MKEELKRTSIRIDDKSLTKLDSFGEETNRSDIIRVLLYKLYREIYFDRIDADNLSKLTHKSEAGGKIVQVRLPSQLINYYQLNKYKISSALRLAMLKYLPDND